MKFPRAVILCYQSPVLFSFSLRHSDKHWWIWYSSHRHSFPAQPNSFMEEQQLFVVSCSLHAVHQLKFTSVAWLVLLFSMCLMFSWVEQSPLWPAEPNLPVGGREESSSCLMGSCYTSNWLSCHRGIPTLLHMMGNALSSTLRYRYFLRSQKCQGTISD